jgi:signal transduction histidine kinase/ligand-binding sensor domain-containing protein
MIKKKTIYKSIDSSKNRNVNALLLNPVVVLIVFLILISLALSRGLYARHTDIHFERFTSEDGLAQLTVGTILQDSRGFMWFGTRGGLNRYDGYQFDVFESDPDDPYSLSSNSVYSLYEDRMGILWVGTGKGLNKFDHRTENFTAYMHDPDNPGSLGGNNVWSIFEDRSGTLWIGTHDGGLNKFDRETNQFIRYQYDPDDPNSLSSNIVETIYEDHRGIPWIGTADGLNKWVTSDGENMKFTCYRNDPEDPFSLSGKHIRSIHEDHTGTLWIGTRYNGLNRFDRETKRFTRFQYSHKDPYSLGEGPVWTILEDSERILWVGIYGGGLNRYDRENNRFVRYLHDPTNPHSLCGNMVEAIYEDKIGALWIGTWDNGVSRLDRKASKFRLYQHDPNNPNSMSGWHVRSICEDPETPDRVLWIGTLQGGLNRFDRVTNTWSHYRHDPNDRNGLGSNEMGPIYTDSTGILWIGTVHDGLNKFNPKTGTFSVYKHDPRDSNSLSNNDIRSIIEHPEGVLWIGTSKGLNKFEINKGTFTHYLHDPLNPKSLGSGYCEVVHSDKSGIIRVGNRGGGLNRFDPGTETFTHYLNDPDNPNTLSDNDVWAIHEDSSGLLWMGTSGGLNTFDPHTKTFIHYRKKDGLSNDSVKSILEDDQGNLWLGTRGGGLSRFDPEKKTFKNYDSNDGLQSNEFPTNAAYKSRTGELFFGGPGGLNAFFPGEVTDSAFIPPVVLTNFKIFNQPVPIGGEDSPLKQCINETEHIILSHHQRVFSFEFAALNYRFPKKNQYAYMMENFESQWNEVDYTRRFAAYTGLPPGDYVFRVKASNNDGVWNEKGKVIKLTVTPPWWQTWWFRLPVIAAILFLILILYKIKTYRLRARSKQLEEINAALNTQISKRKLLEEKLVRQEKLAVLGQLAGGMGHELRNPLGAIKHSAYFLNLALENPEPEVKETLEILEKEVTNSEKIITGLLDFARSRPPFKRKMNINTIIRDVLSITNVPGNIRVRSQVAEAIPFIMADPDQLVKVFEDMILNAVQAMPGGGQLTIKAESPRPDRIAVSITDTGVGIARENLEKIFEPLFTTRAKGIGLGMAIAKTFVEGHGGSIEVQSEPGKGTTFTVTLPIRSNKEE